MCVCGHPNLVQLFTIENVRNGELLRPIGNVCVKKFGREDLNTELSVFSRLLKLRKAIDAGEASFTSEYFSRALLHHLDTEGAFNPDQWDADGGYGFLVDMFNKTKKDDITQKQHWKISLLLKNKVFPFVQASGEA